MWAGSRERPGRPPQDAPTGAAEKAGLRHAWTPTTHLPSRRLSSKRPVVTAEGTGEGAEGQDEPLKPPSHCTHQRLWLYLRWLHPLLPPLMEARLSAAAMDGSSETGGGGSPDCRLPRSWPPFPPEHSPRPSLVSPEQILARPGKAWPPRGAHLDQAPGSGV